MAYAMSFVLNLGPAHAGLADLRAQLVDTAGAASGVAISTGFSDLGEGCYQWYYASFADGFRGGVYFYSNADAGTTLVAGAINPEDGENSDAKVTSRAAAATALSNVVWTDAKAGYLTGDAFVRIGANGVGLSAVPWNAAWDAEVQSECTDALNAYDPPTNAEMEARTIAAASYATAANQTTILGYVDCLPVSWVVPLDAAGVRTAVGLATANLDTQLADLPTVSEFEARTLVAADYFVVGDYTAPPSAVAVWDVLETAILTAGSIGLKLKTNLDVAVSTRSTYAGGAVASVTAAVTTTKDTVIDTIAVDVAGLDGAAMRGTDGAYTGTPPTASTIASQVRLELATELGRLDAAITTRMATFTYTAPDNTGIGNVYAIVNHVTYGNAAIKTAIGSPLTTTDIDNRLAAWGKTGFSITGTLTTLDALLVQLATAHGAGSWLTATGFATPSDVSGLASTLAIAHGAGSWATATGFSTHSAADVVSALGSGSGLTALATAANQTTILGYVDCLPVSWVVPASAGEAMALTSAERNATADVVLGRSVATCEATAAEWSLCTIVLAALESQIVGTTWTIRQTDGVTTHKTKTVATDPNAEPITQVY